MITTGKIPKKLQGFFKPLRDHFTQRPWEHFWALVLAITISHGTTIDKLAKALKGSTHRTNHGEFLWRSSWNHSIVMQQIAFDMLRSLFTKKDRQLFLIVDDTQTLKRAKKMEATGKLRHHATGKYGTGYTIVKVSLYYRGVRHLRLVDCACACLTHMGIKAYRAQGQNKSKKVLRLEPISKLRDRMRRIVRQENVQDVIKYSREKSVIRRLEKLLAA